MLRSFPYIGRYIPEMSDKRFRELIYRKTRYSGYRIMYYILERKNTVYVFYIVNSRQDFRRILKIHKNFNDYLNL